MKFIISLLLLFLSFSGSASELSTPVNNDNTAVIATNDLNDRGRKHNRQKRNKRRTNKKRKRKCSQFGRKIYAG